MAKLPTKKKRRSEKLYVYLFFGLFNYSKPGPGVDKNAPKKKRFFFFFELYFRKFWKLIQLNLLFVVCCIPIVTIGPAIAGMTYVLRNFATEKPVFSGVRLFDAFKSNWKQSFALSVIFGVVSVVSGLSFFWYFANSAGSWLMLISFGLVHPAVLSSAVYAVLCLSDGCYGGAEIEIYHLKCIYFCIFGSKDKPDYSVFRPAADGAVCAVPAIDCANHDYITVFYSRIHYSV